MRETRAGEFLSSPWVVISQDLSFKKDEGINKEEMAVGKIKEIMCLKIFLLWYSMVIMDPTMVEIAGNQRLEKLTRFTKPFYNYFL